MRAENERLENAFNEFLFGYQKIPGLGHNITEVCNNELSLPKHLQQCRKEANDITAAPETDAKMSFPRKDEINRETSRDDGEGFIEWPRLSELIWKSSGLDMMTLGLAD
ncbi:hypothetical protein BFW01_g2288 [Lasiodiplodia theobromae]|nr:hypothetical protein BFW01_g2288 [Lasiodiplodia theobromae]